MEDLIARGHASAPDGIQLMSAPEAERVIEQLVEFSLDDVGSSRWMQQQSYISKLNLQAHRNAQMHADEFVKEAMVSFDKVGLLIHELLVMDVWRQKLLPHLKQHMARKMDSVTVYMLIFHEANLANLLELLLFHEDVVESVSEDALLELVDWCHRKLRYLNSAAQADARFVEQTTQEMMSKGLLEQLEDKERGVRLGVAICSVTMMRYLTDSVARVPIGVVTHMLQTNDTLMAFLPLADSPPWRRQRQGITERFEGNQWQRVAASDRFQLSSTDAQVWLALNNMVVDPKCRAKYRMDSYRKESVMRLKRFLNDLLFDQLPVLKDLQRAIDELSMNANADDATAGSGLILEVVPTMRTQLMKRDDWETLAKKMTKTTLREGVSSAAKERMQEMVKSFDFLAELDQKGDQTATEPTAAHEHPVTVSLWRKGKGAMEAWSDWTFDIDHAQPPVNTELQGDEGVQVTGKRWRLLGQSPDGGRPFPTNGRIAVCHNGCSAEAILNLPAPSTKSAGSLAEVPASIWVTVGMLAQDKFALQLRLKRTEQPKERDSEGVWYVYHVTGGAITLLENIRIPTLPKASPAPVLGGLLDLD